MSSHAVIDVSGLPPHRFDAHAPIWWGNLLMIVIETTMFALVVASYFYLKQNFPEWPPPRTMPPSRLDPLPNALLGTTTLVVLLVSAVPMFWADRAARRGEAGPVKIGMGLAILLGFVAIALRLLEFNATQFRWDSNAYGSIVWTALGFHLFHVASATFETLVLEIWALVKGVDEKHAIDATVNAVYWYWMVGIWIPIYAIIYFAPRFL